MTRAARYLAPLIWAGLLAAGLALLLICNATAREVTLGTLQLLFAVFATPFLLETTCALLFFAGLLAWNRWRLHKEGDGWVYLMTQEPDDKNLPAKITQRLQSVVLKDKPETLDEAQAGAGVIEGYLELGMAAQARQELGDDPAPQPPVASALLRIRVLAANLDTDAALQLLRDTTAAGPGSRPALAAASIENARWLLKHMHREDLARLWLAEARLLDAAALQSLHADEPLRTLA